MTKKYYITTAIAYPNGKPHLGHALEIIQADVVARFHRLLGKDVWFQTGTDEHGVKNWQTAKKEGKDIKDFLNVNVAIFKKLYKTLNISHDYFIRTTDKKIHHPGAIKLWKELTKSGDIYKKQYKGLYCAGCEAFKTEKELNNGICPNHPTRDIQTVEEENYFFKLSKYKDILIKKIKSDEYKVIPEIRKNEILSFLKEAKDISFSRPKTSLPWGITVPDDDKQTMYVWCDALSNYITGAGYGRDDKLFKSLWPADVHIIGKDILRFHAAFWPAMLISGKVALPKDLLVHGFILTKGAKMGKSTGNVIEPFEQIEKYGVDQFRFYIIESMPLGHDGDYSEELVVERINSELVGNLSNFCYRVISFTNKNFESKIKEIDNSPEAKSIIKKITRKFTETKDAYENYDFKKAIELSLSVSALGNKYFQEKEPWKLKDQDKEKAREVLTLCANIAKNLSVLVEPVLPEFSKKLQKQLNVKDLKWKDLNFNLKNHKLNDGEILFRKAEKLKVETKDKGKENKGKDKTNNQDTFNLNIKVAKITDVSDHPNADRLYILKIDLGKEKRQIVAGLKESFKKEELKGKLVPVLTNLEPAKLKGELSEGMILVSVKKKGDKEIIKLLQASKSKPGDAVYLDNPLKNTQIIKYKDFTKHKFNIKDKKVYLNNNFLKTDKESIKADIEDGAHVE